MNGNFVENFKVVEIGVPKSWASTACTQEFVSMKNCERVTWLK